MSRKTHEWHQRMKEPAFTKGAGPRGRQRHAASALALAVCILSFLLPGVSASAADNPAVVKLWDHHVHDKKFRQQIFKEFNKANPDIRVEYTSQIATTYETVLDAAFRSGSPPDLFIPMGAANLPKLVELGWVMPIDDVASTKEDLRKWMATFPQDMLPFVENQNMFGGKVYSWPISAEGGRMMLFWNTKLFREAGLKGPEGGSAMPETWADTRLFAKKITEMGQGKIYGIVHGIKTPGIWDQDLFWSIAVSSGWSLDFGGIDWRTGHFDYHDPGLRGSIQLWLDMKKDGSVFPGDLSMDDEQAKFKLTQDLAGMIFGGPWVPGGFLAVNPDLEFDVVLPPTEVRGVRKGYLHSGALAGSSEYAVSSRTKNRDAVWKVIQFMTSQQYQEEWVKAGGGLSVFPQYNKPEFFPHPTVAKIAQMAITGKRTAPDYPKDWNKLFELFAPDQPDRYETMQGMWIGKLGWEAWDDLERRNDKAFDAALVEYSKTGGKLSRADFTRPDWDPTKNYPPEQKK